MSNAVPVARRVIPRILLIENDEKRHGWFKARIDAQLPTVRLVWCRSSGTALNLLDKDKPDHIVGILLDHDLDYPGMPYLANGLDVVHRLIARWPDATHIPVLVHSANLAGGPKMHDALRGAGFSEVSRKMFFELGDAEFKAWLDKVAELVAELAED